MNATLALSPASAHRETVVTATFPSVSLPMRPGGLPVEVTLVARLGHGAGTRMFFDVLGRQRRHERFIDALDEPSAKIGPTDLAKGDATALYSFGVGSGGHPFHRHAGHRVFTAVSGSGGAQLRFSSATPAELERDPEAFLRALRHVDVPPDSLFTVRFAGDTWHQFAPLDGSSGHPAFFALSTHTNELGGDLPAALRARVEADDGDIPSLTMLLPASVELLMKSAQAVKLQVPTTALSLHDRPGGFTEAACRRFRSMLGHVNRLKAALDRRGGFVSTIRPARVVALDEVPAGSLLRQQLCDRVVHHEDTFTLTVPVASAGNGNGNAREWLALLLDGFMKNPPSGVSRLMALRNVLVSPLRLRTSPLGCPVSSLLTARPQALFDGRFPVLEQRMDPNANRAEVILGADDKHLVFRSSVGVRVLTSGDIEFLLATRVACENLFGRVYMAFIAGTHRRYVSPAMLAHAVDAALAKRDRPANA